MFVVTVLVAKLRCRAKAVAGGRRVFVKICKVSRPQLIGSGEYEVVLRRWIGFGGRGEAAGAGSDHDECFFGTAVQLGPRGDRVWTT